MSFDQLLFAGEFQTREFKINFETDRLLANLGQSAINKLLSNLLELGNKFFCCTPNMPDASVVDYLVMHENEQPLVSKYRQVLPVEDELPAELKKGTAMAGRTKMK